MQDRNKNNTAVWLAKALIARCREIAKKERRTLKSTIEMAIESAIGEEK